VETTLYLPLPDAAIRALRREAKALGVPLDRLAVIALAVYAAECRRIRLVNRAAAKAVGMP
jgi:hypothetical protein